MIDRSLVLPTTADAPARARAALRQAWAEAGTDAELGETSLLLANEVVTNAVLHGAGPVRMRVATGAAWVRVEVDDGSSMLPTARRYGAGATTGRGLELVELLSGAWGVVPLDGGKRIWFELGPVPAAGRSAAPGAGSDHDRRVVVLRGAPVLLVCAALEYADAAVREVALLALDGGLADRLPDGWVEPQLTVDPVLRAVASVPAGLAYADLTFEVGGPAREAALQRLELVDLADQLALEGRLLAAPALPEVTDARKWMLTEIAQQVAGSEPRRWRPPRGRASAREAARLPPEELERLGRAAAPTVVVDDADTVVWASWSAHAALGREPGTLVGERAVTLLAPAARDAHLAAMTRRQLGGHLAERSETRPLTVARPDGTERELLVVVTELRADADRRAYEIRLLSGT